MFGGIDALLEMGLDLYYPNQSVRIWSPRCSMYVFGRQYLGSKAIHLETEIDYWWLEESE